MAGDLDVVVIGAGAAGLAAGRAAEAAGLAFRVIEAKSRTGGRAYTDYDCFGVPFDHGCHWLHSASINPFTALAERYGFTYRRGKGTRKLHDGADWLYGERLDQAGAFIDEAYEAVHAAGAAGRDVAAADAIDGASPFARLFHRSYTSYMAGEPERVSTFDSARYRDTGENWPVLEGFGALIVRHGAAVPVTLDCAATAIDWSGPLLRIATVRGTLTARTVILTPSTDLLGQLRFTPALPGWKRDAIAALPMGAANKIAFAFAGAPFGEGGPYFTMLDRADGSGAVVLVDPAIQPFATLFVGGVEADEMERAGAAAMLAYGRDSLATLFGSALLKQITAGCATLWRSDPDIAGAYAVARPGQGEARAALIRPIADRLFFAGEAASLDSFATAHGAHLSGIAAVEAVVAARSRTGVA